LAKNGLGYILGNFITNPSGHPEFFFLWLFVLPMRCMRLFFEFTKMYILFYWWHLIFLLRFR
jgi:hypothetical protein